MPFPANDGYMYSILDSHGPRDEATVQSRKLTIRNIVRAQVTALLIALLFASAFLTTGLIVHSTLPPLIGLGWYIGTIFFFCHPAIQSRILFRTKNLIDVFRRYYFFNSAIMFSGIGGLLGLCLAFVVSETPGILLPTDVSFYRTALLFLGGTAIIGPAFGLTYLWFTDAKVLQEVTLWINRWRNETPA